jgi:hypothetical protein
MDAPLYPPAAAYEQPQRLPQVLSTRTSSIAELKEDPEAMAILRAALPRMASQADSGPLAVMIEALSIRSALAFGGIKPEDVDRIEKQFAEINARRGLRP